MQQQKSQYNKINPSISRHTASNASINHLQSEQHGYLQIHANSQQNTFIPPSSSTSTPQQQQWSNNRHNNTQESITSTQSAPAYNDNYKYQKQNVFQAPNINPTMQPQLNRPNTVYPLKNEQRHNMSQPHIKPNKPNFNRYNTVPPNMRSPQQRNMSTPLQTGQQRMEYGNINNMNRGNYNNMQHSTFNSSMHPQQIRAGYVPQQRIINITTGPQSIELGRPVISDEWTTKKSGGGSIIKPGKDTYKEPLLDDEIDYALEDQQVNQQKKGGCCVIL